MEVSIETTNDGSNTLYVKEIDEHYHSIKGALTESQHIFINCGLKEIQNDKIEQLRQQVNASNLALFGQQLVNQILPRSVPAYPSCSPYVPATYGCGCGNSSII